MENKSNEFPEVVEVKFYENWWEFTKQVKAGPDLLFRGHSNDYHKEWNLISSFYRVFSDSDYRFQKFSYDTFWNSFELYKNDNLLLKKIKGKSFLERIQFFQHYGVPTPLIDFTKDPITALYFAISGIQHHGVQTGKKISGSNVTIVEINLTILKENFGIERIDENSDVNFQSVIKYTCRSNHLGDAYVFAIPNPKPYENVNLIKQEGAFLYFESMYSLEEFLDDFLFENNSHLKKKPIVYHHIPYDSFMNYTMEDIPNIFRFLVYKKKFGAFLFNDLQGVKYDYNIPNLLSCLNCKDENECKCLHMLRQYNII